MIIQLDPDNLHFILPVDFRPEALLPPELQEQSGTLQLLMHLAVVNRGGALDFEMIDEITGGTVMTSYLFGLLVDAGYLKPIYPAQEQTLDWNLEGQETAQATRSARPPSRFGLRTADAGTS